MCLETHMHLNTVHVKYFNFTFLVRYFFHSAFFGIRHGEDFFPISQIKMKTKILTMLFQYLNILKRQRKKNV